MRIGKIENRFSQNFNLKKSSRAGCLRMLVEIWLFSRSKFAEQACEASRA